MCVPMSMRSARTSAWAGARAARVTLGVSYSSHEYSTAVERFAICVRVGVICLA